MPFFTYIYAMKLRKYTWKPDLPDHRDYKYTAPKIALPGDVDLRGLYSLVYNQLYLGSCTANGIALGFDFERVKQNLKPLLPSRLFIYYNERAMIGTVNWDSGAYIRDGIKSIKKTGVCRESLWPYIISKFRLKPRRSAYLDAVKNRIKSYIRLNNTSLTELKTCLAEGFPFVFGFSVYESFESVDKTGIVPMPAENESLLGGHAVICLGYDDARQVFICRNSWGSSWGDKGHFYMPYAYMTDNNLSDDFWTIRLF